MTISQSDIDSLMASIAAASPPDQADGVDDAETPPAARPDRQGQKPPSRPEANAPSRRSQAIPPKLKRILALRVPVVVQLAERRMPVRQVLELTPGSIIEFEKDVHSDLSLLVKNIPIGSGDAVKCSEHFGLRITRIGTRRQRAEAVAGG